MVQIPVLINGSIAGDTTDLSYTGAKITLKDQDDNFQMGDRLSLQIPEIADLVCQGEVIAKDKGVLRVKFDKIDSDSREILRQWLLSQDVKKA
ncbi:PilZ domain protein [compost metagenome]